MIDFDFTLTKYKKLCKAIISSAYMPLTIHEYLIQNHYDKCIILRHDVDINPAQALKMAQIEHEYGIRSTYYFRTIKKVFQPQIIQQIASFGHEMGYHYEVLDKANGNIDKAVMIFEQELREFRKLVDVTTICMHGNPLTPWLNRDIWKKYNFKDFGIIGEAYISLDYNKILYLTDTGRRWNDSKYSVKDLVSHYSYDGKNDLKVTSTNDVINLIKNENDEQICIQTHPARWNNNISAWLIELVGQNIKNIGKVMINYRKVSHD